VAIGGRDDKPSRELNAAAINGPQILDEGRRISRRRFLVGVGSTVAAASVLTALSPRARGAAGRGVPAGFLTGVDDDFAPLAARHDRTTLTAFDAVGAMNAGVIRFPVRWDQVQKLEGQPFDWSSYEAVKQQLIFHGFKAVPVLIGCPAQFSERGEAAPTGLGLSYPTGGAALNSFGQFAVETVRYLSSYGDHVAAVEIWSRPNDPRGAHIADPVQFSRMLGTAANFIDSANGDGSLRQRVPVVSGGLAIDGTDKWRTYLDGFKHQQFPYVLGVQAYPDANVATSPAQAAAGAARSVVERAKTAQERAGVDVWVTKTAASVHDSLGEEGQALALSEISRGLGALDRCRAMIVSPLTASGQAADASLPKASSLLRGDGSKRPAVTTLQSEWSPKP
jgi:hypothetical protein